MPGKKKTKKRKKIRYLTITFLITSKQNRSLRNFCKSRRTTPRKLIKKSIQAYLQNYTGLEVKTSNQKVNQLKLFDTDESSFSC